MKLSNKVTLLAVLSLVAGVVGVSARAGSVSGLSAASVSAAVISASSLSSLKSSFSSLNVKGKLSAPALTLYASCDDERAAYSSAVSSYNSCLVSTAMGPAKDAYSTVQGWISYCGNLSNTDCAAKVAADQVVYCETTYAPTAKSLPKTPASPIARASRHRPRVPRPPVTLRRLHTMPQKRLTKPQSFSRMLALLPSKDVS